jgi:probable HAF family extracellular repeat protein
MKLRVLPIALWLALSGGVPGLITATAVPAAAATATYTMTDLGSLGYGVSRGFAINAGGEVAGQSYLAQAFPATGCPPRHRCITHPSEPFSWTAGTMTGLGTLGVPLDKITACSPPDCFGEALAINRNGDIAGLSDGQAFLVHNGKMSSLGPGSATGINDFGEIAGGTSCCHAFVISGRTRTTLPDLSSYGGGITSATGISDTRQIVGGSDNAAGYVHAVLWTNGTITDLGTLADPRVAPFAQSTATAISNLGQVTGWAQTNTYATHGFLFSNGTMIDIGAIIPQAINDNGVIVGYGALIYRGGTVQDLNNLIPAGSGFTLDNATAINDNGQIAANGYNAQGQDHAFLLTPG